jgi:hypothetical protein
VDGNAGTDSNGRLAVVLGLEKLGVFQRSKCCIMTNV